MNSIFNVFWNQTLQRFVVTSELGKSRSKPLSSVHHIIRPLSAVFASTLATMTAITTPTTLGLGLAVTAQSALAEPIGSLYQDCRYPLTSGKYSVWIATASIHYPLNTAPKSETLMLVYGDSNYDVDMQGKEAQYLARATADSVCAVYLTKVAATLASTSASEASSSVSVTSTAAVQASSAFSAATSAAEQSASAVPLAESSAKQASVAASSATHFADHASTSALSASTAMVAASQSHASATSSAERAKIHGCRSGMEAGSQGAVACGEAASTSAVEATAVGKNAYASADNAVALGADSVADEANTVSVGNPNLERRITNVADGIAPTDMVNKRQLDRVSKKLRSGIAGVAAVAGIPQATLAGASMFGLGVGNYKSENAIAIGYSHAAENGKLIFRINASLTTRGDVLSNVGISYQY
ncbi:YadA-like family protein [Lonepinella sp. BR2271]|uniref:YadA-like family protein n=1 Tax=Lonepinella sp. BR2271 TaxID=3434550 RepID=UPI003F6DF42A